MDIFLSHSGKQKDFAYHLYDELLRCNHSCFFDQDTVDSLPKGALIQNNILQSIKDCKLGIVVVSEDFITNLWPMAELQNLISAGKLILPIFYDLEPRDLVKKPNLQRWLKTWKKINATAICLQFDISKWKDCLSTVKSTAGSEFNYKSSYKYPFIKDKLVPEICKVYPPHVCFSDDNIQGRERMAKEIEENFQKLISSAQSLQNVKQKFFVLGLYGMGGVGKTTLCKTMVNYYNQRGFNSASCLIDLPTDQVEAGALVPKLKKALNRLMHIRKEELDDITDFDEGISVLGISIQNQRIRGTKAFLAIDNVWTWSYDYVRKIICCMIQEDNKGDIRVMITSQDKNLLDSFGAIRGLHYHSTHVPCMNHDDAWNVISERAKYFTDHHEDKVKAIIDRCFFNKICNPLVLYIICKKLEQTNTNHESVLEECLHQLQGQEDDYWYEQVISFGTKVYQSLNRGLQKVFINATVLYCEQPYLYEKYQVKDGHLFRWLSMLANLKQDKDIMEKLKQLENHGMLRITKLYDPYDSNNYAELEMHDLFIEVGRREAIKRGFYLFSHELGQPEDGKHISVVMARREMGNVGGFLSKLRQCSIDQLKLVHVKCPDLLNCSNSAPVFNIFCWLNSTSTQIQQSSLRILSLSCDRIHKITGLYSAPNLMYLYLHNCRNLEEIQDINHLHNLQELHIFGPRSADIDHQELLIFGPKSALRHIVGNGIEHLEVPNLSSCLNLRSLTLSELTKLRVFAQLECSPSLEVLNLYDCIKLANLEGLESLKSLRFIYIYGCVNLEEFPLVVLPNLKTLILIHCINLTRVMAGSDVWDIHLPSLEVLHVSECGDPSDVGELHVGGKVLNALTVLRSGGFTVMLQKTDRLNTNLEELEISVDTTMDVAEALNVSFLQQKRLRSLWIKFKSSRGGENCDGSAFDDLILPQSLQDLTLINFPGTLLRNLAFVGNTLTLVELSDCPKLKELPNLSRLVNLQILSLRYCPRLKKLPSNLSSLEKLECLILVECESLVLKLEQLACVTSLQYLDVGNCKLVNWEMENLKVFLPNSTIVYDDEDDHHHHH